MTGREPFVSRTYDLGLATFFGGVVAMVLFGYFNHEFMANLPYDKLPMGFWYCTAVAVAGLCLMCVGLIGPVKRGMKKDTSESPGS